jgi:hypothetical protein
MTGGCCGTSAQLCRAKCPRCTVRQVPPARKSQAAQRRAGVSPAGSSSSWITLRPHARRTSGVTRTGPPLSHAGVSRVAGGRPFSRPCAGIRSPGVSSRHFFVFFCPLGDVPYAMQFDAGRARPAKANGKPGCSHVLLPEALPQVIACQQQGWPNVPNRRARVPTER